MAPEFESFEALLARSDERLSNVEKNLAKLADNVCAFNSARRCDRNSEKLYTLERMVWGSAAFAAGSLLMGLGSILYSFFTRGGH